MLHCAFVEIVIDFQTQMKSMKRRRKFDDTKKQKTLVKTPEFFPRMNREQTYTFECYIFSIPMKLAVFFFLSLQNVRTFAK